MLIFLAGLAFLIMVVVIGERGAAHLLHSGAGRFLDYCHTCDVRYRRPAGVPRTVCPQGHPMTPVVAAPHPPGALSIGLLAVCAGFIVVVVLLTATGIVPGP